ncbi:DUF445 domain-containing protein [Pseudobacillus wudalianchiensis]|uniref:DUF445 domain-containing protein n=1 Tax=Pseudobacillus wudalianchiensis TaxID=1743143 RepID=A0A1B9AU10_9BACI|nr:DUF445 family protein [Bacillus wudalianchiensis]OCA87415.1 hypothetical protein A8F95_09290 [Bacillus wudalianchiensis]
MNLFTLIIFMVIIGAAIGAITNAIAIRMLFRPYDPKYIGKWKLPFTPGLIPKRRGELARQIGKTVEEHLLTPESIERKLNEPDFRREVTVMLQKEAKPLLAADHTVAELLEKLQFKEAEQKTERWIESWIDSKYNSIKSVYLHQTVRESLPTEWLDTAQDKIPDISRYILTKGIDYFSGFEGKWRVKKMTDDFLAEWGKLGSMLQMILGNTSLEEKIQPEIIKFLSSPGTKDLLNTLLQKEWEKLLDWKWEDVLKQFSDEKALAKGKSFVLRQLDLPSLFQKPVAHFLQPFEEKITEEVIPALVEKAGSIIASRIPAVMQKLRIGDIVREQVETFSLQRLEQIVLDISRRELKMITLLGGLLGGAIGLIQGLIVGLL